MKELIKRLVEATGPSGFEDSIREIIYSEIKSFADDIKVDALGNLIAHKGKKSPSGKKVMFSGHMDEIGLIATHVDKNGFIRFAAIGGVRAYNCIGGRVRFVNGNEGVIGSDRIENPERVMPLEKLFIDIGATSASNCRVRVGDIGVFERPFLDLGDRMVAKAMDDRVGVAVMIETFKRINYSPHDLYFVFSVQEEVGLRGATTSCYGVDPDIGISVDVTLTGDTPKSAKMEVGLGNGPAIKVRDSGMLSDPGLVRLLVRTAERNKLPYQLEVLERGTTDARAMQMTRSGVHAGCVSIPCRYVHSPSEMVDYNDIQNGIKLLLEFITNPIELK